MPTQKLNFTLVIKKEYLDKMRYIAAHETRSTNNLLEHLCKLYIQQYQQKNGEIDDEKIKSTLVSLKRFSR